MFFIVNKTKQVIVIGDLKVTLGPRQAIDLDSKIDRFVSNNSKNLKTLISKGSIEVKRKDVAEKPVSDHIPQPKNTTDIDISKMKDEILQGVRESMSEMLKPQNQVKENTNISPEELAQMIASLINGNNVKKNIENDDIIIDENILSDIHSKTIDKKMKNIECGDISYNTQKSENTLDDNISELENLIG
jgi:hypothetical protein